MNSLMVLAPTDVAGGWAMVTSESPDNTKVSTKASPLHEWIDGTKRKYPARSAASVGHPMAGRSTRSRAECE